MNNYVKSYCTVNLFDEGARIFNVVFTLFLRCFNVACTYLSTICCKLPGISQQYLPTALGTTHPTMVDGGRPSPSPRPQRTYVTFCYHLPPPDQQQQQLFSSGSANSLPRIIIKAGMCDVRNTTDKKAHQDQANGLIGARKVNEYSPPTVVDEHSMAWTGAIISECTFIVIECPTAHWGKLWFHMGGWGKLPIYAFVRPSSALPAISFSL